METKSPTGSYEITLPDGVNEEIDETVTSFWISGNSLLLQMSSYARSVGTDQVGADERLRNRILKAGGNWNEVNLEFTEPVQESAAASTVDDDGTKWLHIYLTWPDLALYATVSGDPDQVDRPDNWAIRALKTLRRI